MQIFFYNNNSIIAKRAGYNFIEMNASDDRSVDSFKQNIESVTQIRGTVNDDGFKPNCLIIDEIDGAPQVCYLSRFHLFR